MNRAEIVHLRGRSRRLRLAASAAALVCIALPAFPASANPDDTRVLAYRMPCSGTVCDDESRRISGDDVTDGNLQLQAKTSSAIGLTSVELQLSLGGDWRCVYRWTTSARSGTWHRNIDLSGRLEGCDGSSLTDGSNGVFKVRTLASDRSGSEASLPLTLRVSTPPVAPSWASPPEREAGDDGAPSVQLRWHANPEPDIVEYHFIRDDGDDVVEYAISATRPGAQGCSLSNGIYTCTDDAFPEDGYSGNYRYALAAFRSSPDDRSSCSLPGNGSCVRSANSSTQTLALRQPPPPPEDPNERPDDGRDGNGSSGGIDGSTGNDGSRPEGPPRPYRPSLNDLATGNFDFEGGSYELELPYAVQPSYGSLPAPGAELGEFDDGSTYAFGEPVADQERQQQGLTALAGGFLLLVLAVHLARVLRAPARR